MNIRFMGFMVFVEVNAEAASLKAKYERPSTNIR